MDGGRKNVRFSRKLTLSSALSIKFNLKHRKNELEKIIRELHKIKDKLDFVIIYSPITNEQRDRQTDIHTNICTKLTKDSKQVIRVSVTQ